MLQKVQHAKNILFFFILIFFANKVSSQEIENNFDQFFVKSFYKNFRVPKSIRDSCAGTSILLDFYVDGDFNLMSFKFSDNAGKELKDELLRISKKTRYKVYFKSLKK